MILTSWPLCLRLQLRWTLEGRPRGWAGEERWSLKPVHTATAGAQGQCPPTDLGGPPAADCPAVQTHRTPLVLSLSTCFFGCSRLSTMLSWAVPFLCFCHLCRLRTDLLLPHLLGHEGLRSASCRLCPCNQHRGSPSHQFFPAACAQRQIFTINFRNRKFTCKTALLQLQINSQKEAD